MNAGRVREVTSALDSQLWILNSQLSHSLLVITLHIFTRELGKIPDRVAGAQFAAEVAQGVLLAAVEGAQERLDDFRVVREDFGDEFLPEFRQPDDAGPYSLAPLVALGTPSGWGTLRSGPDTA